MAFITIGDKELKSRTDFKFERLANERYNKEDGNGNAMGGFLTIYMNLLEYDTSSLLAFWDCGLAHLKKDKPSTEAIEEALYEQIEEKGDTEPLFKEAFKELDESVFFKKKVKEFWKDLDGLGKHGETEKEKEQNKEMAKRMKQRRKEITA